jgi:hypothetical protein
VPRATAVSSRPADRKKRQPRFRPTRFQAFGDALAIDPSTPQTTQGSVHHAQSGASVDSRKRSRRRASARATERRRRAAAPAGNAAVGRGSRRHPAGVLKGLSITPTFPSQAAGQSPLPFPCRSQTGGRASRRTSLVNLTVRMAPDPRGESCRLPSRLEVFGDEARACPLRFSDVFLRRVSRSMAVPSVGPAGGRCPAQSHDPAAWRVRGNR